MKTLRAAALTSLLALAAGVGIGASPAGVFEFKSLNRRYSQLTSDIAPYTTGPLTVYLSSPRHELELVSNRLALTPLGKGAYQLALTVEFAGNGDLVADLDVSGTKSRFTDLLTVPPQQRTVEAKVEIARSKSGFLITPRELPASFNITIQSRLGGQLLTACRPLSLLVALDCGALEQAFTRVEVPLPPTGETYLFELERLSEAERHGFDAFLAQTGALTLPN